MTEAIHLETYHVSQDLGEDWLDHEALGHIQRRIRHLAFPIAHLVEDPTNVRMHPEENLEGIRGSYAKYKQRVLLVVNTRTMIVEKGNGSLRSLKRGGYEYAAVLLVDDDPATATGFAIADNRTAETAGWDLPGLFKQLDSLKAVDHEVPGIEPAFFDELKTLVGGAGFTPPADDPSASPDQEDPQPEAEETPPANSQVGAVYMLGTCALQCGDNPEECDAIRKLWGDYARKTKATPGDGAL